MRALADDLQQRLDSYGPLLDSIIQQLNELLEYATDPALQLVEEVLQLRTARDSLLGRLNHACRERDALRAEVLKMGSLLQQAHYAKEHAESTAAELREELEARAAAHDHDIRSLKGELASKDRSHDEAMNKLRTQHGAEKAQLQAAHKIEISDVRSGKLSTPDGPGHTIRLLRISDAFIPASSTHCVYHHLLANWGARSFGVGRRRRQ
jgi:hypothetical protein